MLSPALWSSGEFSYYLWAEVAVCLSRGRYFPSLCQWQPFKCQWLLFKQCLCLRRFIKNSVLSFSIEQNKVMVSKRKVVVYFLPHFESLSQELLFSKCTETARWVLIGSSVLQSSICLLSEVVKQGSQRLGYSPGIWWAMAFCSWRWTKGMLPVGNGTDASNSLWKFIDC